MIRLKVNKHISNNRVQCKDEFGRKFSFTTDTRYPIGSTVLIENGVIVAKGATEKVIRITT